MSENFQEAFTLLGVGMVTVFIILLIVVLLGNGIILFVNRFYPDITKSSGVDGNVSGVLSVSKTAAIVAAVKMVTKGKGRVVKIEKHSK